MSKTVLFDTDRNELVELDSKQEKLYNEYLEYDKHVGMFETMFSISDALSNNLISITKDNIHLYYEFMSDDDKSKYSVILSQLFYSRQGMAINIFNVKNAYNNKNVLNIVWNYHNKNVCGYSIFGIKDTLKPIDEYISDIKESSEYKEYIESKEV